MLECPASRDDVELLKHKVLCSAAIEPVDVNPKASGENPNDEHPRIDRAGPRREAFCSERSKLRLAASNTDGDALVHDNSFKSRNDSMWTAREANKSKPVHDATKADETNLI